MLHKRLPFVRRGAQRHPFHARPKAPQSSPTPRAACLRIAPTILHVQVATAHYARRAADPEKPVPTAPTGRRIIRRLDDLHRASIAQPTLGTPTPARARTGGHPTVAPLTPHPGVILRPARYDYTTGIGSCQYLSIIDANAPADGETTAAKAEDKDMILRDFPVFRIAIPRPGRIRGQSGVCLPTGGGREIAVCGRYGPR